jgi:6-phosphogluconate dehydrogenase
MQLGMVGLGRMGANMTTRLLLRGGHTGRRVRPHPDAVAALRRRRCDRRRPSLRGSGREALAAALAVWIMVPSGKPTDSTISELLGLLAPGDIIIDGGNSNFRDSQARCKRPRRRRRLHRRRHVGRRLGAQERLLPDGRRRRRRGENASNRSSSRSRRRTATRTSAPRGAGHFSKMVHNGIEYGMLAAYGEGFEILEKSEFGYDLHQLADLWLHGSVVRSWLLELLELAFREDPKLADIRGYVDDSGEGRWTVQAAIDENVPAPVITMSLLSRFVSRQDESFSAKVIAALRNEFGGHAVKHESHEGEAWRPR